MTHTGTAVPTAVHPPRTAAGPEHAHALVLAPVTPAWDEGAFFAPVIDTLTAAGAGLRVTVVDTLALRDERVRTLDDLVARWRALLPAFGRIDLLCGNALGGAVAQGLLPYVAPGTAALLVSGPARSDALLEHRLTEIADLAATGHTEASLALLHERVQPGGTPLSTGPRSTATAARTAALGDAAWRAAGAAGDLGRPVPAGAAPAVPGGTPAARTGVPADLPRPAYQTPAQRLDGGLRLLSGIDLAPAVEAHPGPLLHIVGGRSQLVTRRHTAAGPHHRVHAVAEAGMRPHFDQPAEVSALVGAFLREKGLT
ncbi:alpha/beta fold hydrolase [Streptomyces collinus]|uniref:alpha/beta fold hydrolase n=1 Tax=Streptomyces collinus TaxID=42684 RepID=UPI0038215829